MTADDRPVAIVTGGGRGIGRASALALGRKGFAVALVDRLTAELEAAAAAVRGFGVEALALTGDVADFAGTQALGRRILDAWGRADVLVNNAGISQPKGLLELSEAEWDHTLAVNLKGMFNWCKAVVPAMLARQAGRIVNISSVSAHTGAGFSAVSKSAYCAAKAGVLGLTRGLAKELAPHITVNAVCPRMTSPEERVRRQSRRPDRNTTRWPVVTEREGRSPSDGFTRSQPTGPRPSSARPRPGCGR